MNWLADNYGSMAGVDGPTDTPLTFTGADMADWTPEDHEAAQIAMDRDTRDRMDALRAERDALRADLEWFRDRVQDLEDAEAPA